MQKHHFRAISLLSATKGVLKVSIIPAVGQPDWILPSALILDTVAIAERTEHYLWQHQDGSQSIPVYPLVPEGAVADTVVILEGSNDEQRSALYIQGEIQTMHVRISEVKDVSLSQEVLTNIKNSTPKALLDKSGKEHFVYQAVSIGDELYIIPNLYAIVETLLA